MSYKDAIWRILFEKLRNKISFYNFLLSKWLRNFILNFCKRAFHFSSRVIEFKNKIQWLKEKVGKV